VNQAHSPATIPTYLPTKSATNRVLSPSATLCLLLLVAGGWEPCSSRLPALTMSRGRSQTSSASSATTSPASTAATAATHAASVASPSSAFGQVKADVAAKCSALVGEERLGYATLKLGFQLTEEQTEALYDAIKTSLGSASRVHFTADTLWIKYMPSAVHGTAALDLTCAIREGFGMVHPELSKALVHVGVTRKSTFGRQIIVWMSFGRCSHRKWRR
jgi:hypothetical protein